MIGAMLIHLVILKVHKMSGGVHALLGGFFRRGVFSANAVSFRHFWGENRGFLGTLPSYEPGFALFFQKEKGFFAIFAYF